jgi:hypothetical protein
MCRAHFFPQHIQFQLVRGTSPADGMVASALVDTDHDGLLAALRQPHKHGVKANILKYLINQHGIDEDAVRCLVMTDNLI